MARVNAVVEEEGLRVLGWRDVPIDASMIGPTALSVMPTFRQLFVDDPDGAAGVELDRKLFVVRKRCEHEHAGTDADAVYFPSLSSRTLVYKGMLTTPQLAEFFPDLADERVESALALVHSRFSTNTFPSWPLAHPYRYLAHNGEINTVQGNRNWMRAREALMETPLIPGLERAFPIVTPGASDTASFDECLELLHLAGRPIWHAALMMIPEAWENHATMAADERAFYRFHASLMEPWDGPASITFTDGTVVGAVLDRNGLRPSRYWVTDDDRVIMASEAGVVDGRPGAGGPQGPAPAGADVPRRHGQGPHRRRRRDQARAGERAALRRVAASRASSGSTTLPDRVHVVPSHGSVLRRQATFGYTHEELKLLRRARWRAPAPRRSARWAPTRPSRCSPSARACSSTTSSSSSRRSPTRRSTPSVRSWSRRCRRRSAPRRTCSTRARSRASRWSCPSPSSTTTSWPSSSTSTVTATAPSSRPRSSRGSTRSRAAGARCREALDRVRTEASAAIAEGKRILVLSDRDSTDEMAPIPSLLLTSAVHHHLIREKTRTQVGLVVEAGDAREVHHMALLVGYGAGAINPYLAFESIEDLIAAKLYGLAGMDPKQAVKNYIKAAGKGVLKVMSKMGISTVASVLRRAGVRGDRPQPGTGRRVLHRHGVAPRRHRSRRDRGGGGARATPSPTRHGPTSGRTAISTSAASTSGAARASTTCSTRRRCSSSSTRRAPSATTCTRSTPPWSTRSRRAWPPSAACSSCVRACASRCRSTRWSRPPRSSSASPPARCPTARSRPRHTRPSPSP